MSDLTGAVIGAFFEVYRVLKYGHLESTYAGALAVELTRSGIRYQREFPIETYYKRQVVGHYRADFIVEQRLVLELKPIAMIGRPEKMHVLNYLCATNIKVGLLLNFGPDAKFLRLINGRRKSVHIALPFRADP